ncbi:hypothetical protein ALQ64_02816 [Pseudomonas cannabina]|uniref:Uncharacterized protein n=1 Tax=Pseudomonas cannabina TaxID=86840 RepID=A0A3M3KDB9_PSECA|nr:hypothetical protein [Pseudomonas cannabina]RMN21099.1 hypothetical protein ALQ64_02816 [Pseudomonas cannabina]
MIPNARYEWLKLWFTKNEQRKFGDVLDADLVYAYIEATGCEAKVLNIGAPRCAQLGRDLSAMFADGVLERSRVGMPAGDASMGFPKWIYSYYLKD